jgi:hypothetical protein
MERFPTSLGSSAPANYSGCAWARISDFGEAENMESSIWPTRRRVCYMSSVSKKMSSLYKYLRRSNNSYTNTNNKILFRCPLEQEVFSIQTNHDGIQHTQQAMVNLLRRPHIMQAITTL